MGETMKFELVSDRQTNGKRLRGLSAAVVSALLALVLVVGIRWEHARGLQRTGLLDSELTIRSATLVVKDLADKWQLMHYDKQPFEFCGKSQMSTRQLKACADHYLSLLAFDGSVKGLPTVKAFDYCMSAQNDYQLKACIWAVSSALKPSDLIALEVTPTPTTRQALTLTIHACVHT